MFAFDLAPWYEPSGEGLSRLYDYLRVCPVVAPWMLKRLFGKSVAKRDLVTLRGEGFIHLRQWRGEEVFWVHGIPSQSRVGYPDIGWDPMVGPFVLSKVREDLLGRRGFQGARLLLGWDFVEWLYEFLDPKVIPHHWSSEEGFVGAGLLYGVDASGQVEITVVLPSNRQKVEPAFRSLMRDLSGLLAWLVEGADTQLPSVQVIWLAQPSAECPAVVAVKEARRRFGEVWNRPKSVRLRSDQREVSIDRMGLREMVIAIPRDRTEAFHLWDLPPGGRGRLVAPIVPTRTR
jgi:hypothetical protein